MATAKSVRTTYPSLKIKPLSCGRGVGVRANLKSNVLTVLLAAIPSFNNVSVNDPKKAALRLILWSENYTLTGLAMPTLLS